MDKRQTQPTKLPFRLGSIHFRHGSWWLIYRGPEDTRVQENSGTADAAEAYAELARRVSRVLRQRVAILNEIARTKREVA